ncbi:MAG TPA: TrkH family potassium uptake protein [Gaiellaceae bacterium]|nr:TrkH family potassium uptake protein [Gaiellaceae bacterium]
MPRVTVARLRRLFRRETVGVDVAAALDLVGGLLKWLGLAFLAPAALAVAWDEPAWPFLVGGVLVSGFGLALDRLATGEKEQVRPREGFLVVALVWLLVPAFGAVPFVLGDVDQLSSPLDAYFESMSGFTATGATILTDIEALPRSMLFWRQFTQWLGGMGIIVLALAVLPRLRVGGRQLLERELPGPTEIERLTTSIRETARQLWVLYVGLTAALTLLLAAYGWMGIDDRLDLFEAVSHAFTTVAIGGFSTQATSVSAFGPLAQWTIALFIVLAGINFLRLYMVFVQRRPRVMARDEEFRLYLFLLLLGSAVLLAELIGDGRFAGEEVVRMAVFQAVSIMTTTGFATADYTTWGALTAVTLVALMFAGASAGSTGGSIKIVRHLLIGRLLRRELDQTVHPEIVLPIRLNSFTVDEKTLRAVLSFVLLYVGLFALGTLALAVESFRAETGVTPFEVAAAAAATLGNVGPGFGFAGPFGSYAPFSDLSTVIMTALMWLGRVEIVPIVVLFTKAYWRA